MCSSISDYSNMLYWRRFALSHCLTWANSADDKVMPFSQKTGFDISCKLSPLETICLKCQKLFSGYFNLPSAENFT